MAIPAKHFTVRTLAEHWDCSEKHVRNLIDKRGLPALRIGNLIRIRREDVLSYEQKHIDTPCPEESVTSQSPSYHRRRQSLLLYCLVHRQAVQTYINWHGRSHKSGNKISRIQGWPSRPSPAHYPYRLCHSTFLSSAEEGQQVTKAL